MCAAPNHFLTQRDREIWNERGSEAQNLGLWGETAQGVRAFTREENSVAGIGGRTPLPSTIFLKISWVQRINNTACDSTGLSTRDSPEGFLHHELVNRPGLCKNLLGKETWLCSVASLVPKSGPLGLDDPSHGLYKNKLSWWPCPHVLHGIGFLLMTLPPTSVCWTRCCLGTWKWRCSQAHQGPENEDANLIQDPTTDQIPGHPGRMESWPQGLGGLHVPWQELPHWHFITIYCLKRLI